MDHKPMNELADEMTALKLQIEIGANYAHYKDASKTYIVRNLVVIEATEEIGVVYQANYGPRLMFVRPASEWLAEVDGHARFTKV